MGHMGMKETRHMWLRGFMCMYVRRRCLHEGKQQCRVQHNCEDLHRSPNPPASGRILCFESALPLLLAFRFNLIVEASERPYRARILRQ